VRRLKEARDEAATEIEQLKRAKQAAHLEYEQNLLNEVETHAEDWTRETEKDLQLVKKLGEEKMEHVVGLVVKSVLRVDPQVHKNHL